MRTLNKGMAARYQQENHVTRYPVILYRSVVTCLRGNAIQQCTCACVYVDAVRMRTLNKGMAARYQLPAIQLYHCRNTQTVIGHTNLCNKYGGPWTLAILALPDNLTFDLTHLIRMHIDGKI